MRIPAQSRLSAEARGTTAGDRFHRRNAGSSFRSATPCTAAAAADLPDATTLPIAAARAQLTAASLAWNVDLPELPAVADLSVPGQGGAIRLRQFRPRAGARLPLVVYLHGGGWTFGSVDTHDRLMRLLALAADAAVIGVDYRLAPEHPYPTPLEDCLAAAEVPQELREYPGLVHGFLQMTARCAAARAAMADAGQALRHLLASGT